MTDERPHVISVGFSQDHRDALDFDRYRISVLVHDRAAQALPRETTARFNDMLTFDGGGPSAADQLGYDRASAEIVRLADILVERHGPPASVLGLFENTIMAAALIRDRWAVAGVDAATATLFRDKVRMKAALSGTGVRAPRFWAVGPATPPEVIATIADGLPGRIVLKPISQAASLGITIFEDGAAFLRHVEQHGLVEGYEVEEFIDGDICLFDGVVRGGVMRYLSASRYLGNIFDFRYHGQPIGTVTIDDPALVQQAHDFTRTVLTALGLVDSTFHLEAFLTDDGDFVFLEVACRFGGAGISAHLKAVDGVDLVDESVRACLGQPSRLPDGPAPRATPGDCASGFLWLPLVERRECVVRRIHGLDRVPLTVVSSDIPNIGQVLNENIGVWPTAGKFLLAGSDAATVEADMRSIAETFRLELDVAPASGR